MTTLTGLSAVAAAATAALTAIAGPAAAADGVQHQLTPIAGASFTCPGAALTATSGQITFDYHVTTADDGNVHDNGRGTPHDAVLEDTAGALYRLVGAFSFTDTYDATTGATIAGTVSDQFVVLNAAGAVVGRVGLLEHLRRDGTLLDIQFGTCTDNND